MPKVYGCPCNASRIFIFRFRQCAPRRSRPASRPGALPSVGKAGQPSWAGAPAACSGRSAAMRLAACGGRRADLADEACAGKELKEEAPFLGHPLGDLAHLFPLSDAEVLRSRRAQAEGLALGPAPLCTRLQGPADALRHRQPSRMPAAGEPSRLGIASSSPGRPLKAVACLSSLSRLGAASLGFLSRHALKSGTMQVHPCCMEAGISIAQGRSFNLGSKEQSHAGKLQAIDGRAPSRHCAFACMSAWAVLDTRNAGPPLPAETAGDESLNIAFFSTNVMFLVYKKELRRMPASSSSSSSYAHVASTSLSTPPSPSLAASACLLESSLPFSLCAETASRPHPVACSSAAGAAVPPGRDPFFPSTPDAIALPSPSGPAAWNSRPLSLSGTCSPRPDAHCPGGFKCSSARTGTLSGAAFQTLSFQRRRAASAALSRPAERRFRSISASMRLAASRRPVQPWRQTV